MTRLEALREYEVIWNGGALLPDRCEGVSPMWRGMLSDQESGLLRRFLLAGSKLGAEIRTGRYCACGCGQEMVYASTGKARDRRALYRTGHHGQGGRRKA